MGYEQGVRSLSLAQNDQIQLEAPVSFESNLCSVDNDRFRKLFSRMLLHVQLGFTRFKSVTNIIALLQCNVV